MSHKSNKQNKQSRRQYDSDVSTINSSYDPLIAQQKQTNLATEAGTNVEGLVSGRTRYASAIQGGILTGVVKEGLRSVAEIVNRKNAAIQVAATARDDRDAKALEAAMKAKKDLAEALVKKTQDTFDNALKTKADLRQEAKFEIETGNSNAENLAPTVFKLMTGNEAEDFNTIKTIAEQRKIDAPTLLRYIEKYKNDQADQNTKNLPTLVREYEYAKDKGYFDGSFIEYQKLRAGINKAPPKSKVLNLKEGVKLGIPELAGVSEDELVYDLIDPSPPKWFLQKYYKDNPLVSQTNPRLIIAEWEKFRTNSTITNYTKGINSNSGLGELTSVIQSAVSAAAGYNPD